VWLGCGALGGAAADGRGDEARVGIKSQCESAAFKTIAVFNEPVLNTLDGNAVCSHGDEVGVCVLAGQVHRVSKVLALPAHSARGQVVRACMREGGRVGGRRVGREGGREEGGRAVPYQWPDTQNIPKTTPFFTGQG
jgi:hypothetical protein